MVENLELETVRRKLEEERAALTARIDNEEAKLSASVGTNPDRVDLAQDYRARQRTQTLLAQSRQQLEQVETALNRLDEGTYGTCANCGKPISPARLEALPSALYCVNCQRQRST